jgi:hypothetical protein
MKDEISLPLKLLDGQETTELSQFGIASDQDSFRSVGSLQQLPDARGSRLFPLQESENGPGVKHEALRHRAPLGDVLSLNRPENRRRRILLFSSTACTLGELRTPGAELTNLGFKLESRQ